MYILDSKRSEEASGFTMVFILFNFFFIPCIQNFYQKECLDFNIYSNLSFSKLDQDGTLKRSFFDFFNSYLVPQEKPPKKYEKPLKIGF